MEYSGRHISDNDIKKILCGDIFTLHGDYLETVDKPAVEEPDGKIYKKYWEIGIP